MMISEYNGNDKTLLYVYKYLNHKIVVICQTSTPNKSCDNRIVLRRETYIMDWFVLSGLCVQQTDNKPSMAGYSLPVNSYGG